MELPVPVRQLDCPIPFAAPLADQFPVYPQSWYLFCHAAELREKPLTRTLFGRQLTAFRTASERIGILDGRCSHLGADLGCGRVVGEAIQCPFHHWEYNCDGQCVRIPAQDQIPAFAEQRAYPVAERHGYVFVFNGRKPLFALPFFQDSRPEEYAAGRVLHFSGDCSWQMLASNNCDMQHWNTVHDRQLLGPPVIDRPHAYARRMRFEALVIGSSIFDRLLRRFAGDRVQVSITNWGGVFFTVTGFFRHVHSRLIVCVRPEDENRHVEIDVIVHVRRGRGPSVLMAPFSLWIRRLFTWGFMRGEFERLQGIRYSPNSLIESDRAVIEFFQWAAALPGERRSHRRSLDGDAIGKTEPWR